MDADPNHINPNIHEHWFTDEYGHVHSYTHIHACTAVRHAEPDLGARYGDALANLDAGAEHDPAADPDALADHSSLPGPPDVE